MAINSSSTPLTDPASQALTMGFILDGYPRISETFIANEIRFLEDHGFTIHIFALQKPREAFTHGSAKAIKATVDYLPKNVLNLARHNLALALTKPLTYTRAWLKACQCALHTGEFGAFKHLAKAACLVHDLLPDRGIRHLHAHFAHNPASVAMFAGLLSGLPHSFTAHARDVYTSPPWLIRENIRAADYVITCTEYNRQYLLNVASGSATPVRRIYHGVNLEYFTGKTYQEPAKPPYRILTVARLCEKKGLPTIFRALVLLREQGFDFRHVLIGDGPQRQKVLALIEELGLGDVVQWLGALPQESVLEHYRQADLMVMGCEVAANGDRDGLPNVLVEAMATGLPVVATSVSAIPELVEDRLTGLLVSPGAPDEMAAAMVRLLTDSDLRATVVANARARVAERFDIRAAEQELAALHGHRLAGGPGFGLE